MDGLGMVVSGEGQFYDVAAYKSLSGPFLGQAGGKYGGPWRPRIAQAVAAHIRCVDPGPGGLCQRVLAVEDP